MSEQDEWFRHWEIPDYSVVVRLIDHPSDSEAPHEVWTADLLEVEDVEHFDFNAMQRIGDALLSEEHGTAPFVISQNRTYSNWGADASTQQLVVEIAADIAGLAAAGVVGNSVYDVLKSVIKALATEARDRSDWSPSPVEEGEAVFRARWHVIRQFGLQADEDGADRTALETVGVEMRSDGSWLVRLRDHEDDRRLEVELLNEDGLVIVGKVGWRSGD
jgi:hypothetical protein